MVKLYNVWFTHESVDHEKEGSRERSWSQQLGGFGSLRDKYHNLYLKKLQKEEKTNE